jgi:hypothetical protein
MSGTAELVIGVLLLDGNTVTLRQPLDDARVATLLQQLANVLSVRAQSRNQPSFSQKVSGFPPGYPRAMGVSAVYPADDKRWVAGWPEEVLNRTEATGD